MIYICDSDGCGVSIIITHSQASILLMGFINMHEYVWGL